MEALQCWQGGIDCPLSTESRPVWRSSGGGGNQHLPRPMLGIDLLVGAELITIV
jgi:hypothetical protein